MGHAVKTCLEMDSLEADQIKWLVPHQANIRIIDALAKHLNFSVEKVFKTVQKYGNTSGSSVGIALTELADEKEIQVGDHILLVAFGAGLTWGAATLTKIA
jgi:3-oxoacyl-[acyl-carrier-protein] synthase-3